MLIPDLLNILFDQSDYGSLLVLRVLHRRKTAYAYKYSLSRYYDFAHCKRDITFICEEGRIKAIKHTIFANDINIHFGCDDMLHWSIGHLESLKYLVNIGANINAVNNYAYRLSVEFGYLDTAKYLSSFGVCPITLNTMLEASAYYGYLDVTKYLIGAGANANDIQALRRSVNNGHFEVAKYLVSVGANVHIDNDFTLRQCVDIVSCNLKAIKFLVDAGADIHASNDEVLRNCAGNGYVDAVEYLISVGANVHANNNEIFKHPWIKDKYSHLQNA